MVGEKAAQGSARGWQQMLPEESILLLGPDLWEPSQILSLGGGTSCSSSVPPGGGEEGECLPPP